MKTVAQTAVATIGTTAVISEVNWVMVASTSVLAGVLSILTSIISLVAVLVKPLIKWNTSLTENTMALRAQTETIKSNETRNEKEHTKIWDELGEHDKRISCIEKRGAD